ncbi:MAG TPA: AAA family ATPase [Pirellulales bacterium]|jgi:type II secretory pathway predicted ATPase ExeA|nr:AAA family ATPase [Pirellulales bacterium]
MYEEFFQLKQRPFAAAPRVDRYFPGKAIETSRRAIARCVERAEGAGLLIGPPGTGKTLLCHMLAEQFRGKFAVAMLSNGHLDNRRELLQAILFELGLPYRRLEEGELRLSLIDHVSNDQSSRGGLLLIVDEAHTLSPRLLEEVRLIANLVRNGQPRVRLVLAGNPTLEECLADPALEALGQRITTRCYLEALDYDQTQKYVLAQMTTLGGGARQVFTPEALEAIYHATDGVPRLINQLCDHVLMLAYAGGKQQIGPAGVDEAWSDLQQLPSPWVDRSATQPGAKADADFIEFGDLHDEPSVAVHAELPLEEVYFEPAGQVGPAAEATLLIHQIDDHLNDLEREYVVSPAAGPGYSSGTWSADPFSERFDEEEVLIDRYTSLGAVAGLQQVESDDGRALAALLEPFEQFESPMLSVVGSPVLAEGESLVASVVTGPEAVHASNPLAPFSASTLDTVAPTVSLQSLSADEGTAADWAGETASEQPEESFESDEDLMIVEEDPRHEIHPPSRLRAAQVRRQEYRQLFSSLRRG